MWGLSPLIFQFLVLSVGLLFQGATQAPPFFWCLPLFIWAISRKLLQNMTIKLLSRLHKHQNYAAQEAWEAYEGRTNRIDWWKCQLLPMEKNMNLKKISLLINDNHSWQKYKKLRKIWYENQLWKQIVTSPTDNLCWTEEISLFHRQEFL